MDSGEKPPLYSLVDLMNDKVPGHFYKEELQKAPSVDYNKHFFEVEKVIKKKTIKKKLYLYVKFMYYPNKFNQWIPFENVKRSLL